MFLFKFISLCFWMLDFSVYDSLTISSLILKAIYFLKQIIKKVFQKNIKKQKNCT